MSRLLTRGKCPQRTVVDARGFISRRNAKAHLVRCTWCGAWTLLPTSCTTCQEKAQI